MLNLIEVKIGLISVVILRTTSYAWCSVSLQALATLNASTRPFIPLVHGLLALLTSLSISFGVSVGGGTKWVPRVPSKLWVSFPRRDPSRAELEKFLETTFFPPPRRAAIYYLSYAAPLLPSSVSI
ncbi:hypothetical protein BDN72DRAFT_841049 [Pluteus cervinus]|uniref:Uncharacterized protein n=1 Tax=Pluteus cervinus TaxID=181527 RepID=A0ACD3ATL9_9AGAR|nr:hypothetical protein BDN72DRAFT_841049 [Pluteus cervinus]